MGLLLTGRGPSRTLHIQMGTTENPLDHCMYFVSARLHRVLERMAEDRFSATGLPPSHAFLLMTVEDSPGITAGELARALHLAPSTLTRFLDRLEEKGLVRRSREGRQASVEPTAKGRRLRPALDAGWEELWRDYTAILGKVASDALVQAMVAAGDALETAEKGAGTPETPTLTEARPRLGQSGKTR